MKTYLLFFALLLVMACKKDKGNSDYNCEDNIPLTINNVNNENCVNVTIRTDYFDVQFNQYTQGLINHFGARVLAPYSLNGSYRLHSLYSDSIVSSSYEELCCYNNPDQVNKVYYIYEPDSLNNFLRFHIDTLTQQASGMIKGTYVNYSSPYDTLRIQCDTFSCKYIKQ